jgi:hypothetical protein
MPWLSAELILIFFAGNDYSTIFSAVMEILQSPIFSMKGL